MNRLIFPFPPYPLSGDIQSQPGGNYVTVVGLQRVALDPVTVGNPNDGDIIVFRQSTDQYVAQPNTIITDTDLFADDEVVAGSGTSWTLAHTPSDNNTLKLFQFFPMFGWTLLVEGVEYSISGNAITTFGSITAGDLIAWYRYASSSGIANNEIVAGSGTSWTLTFPPSPSLSLQLFQFLPSFGWTLLINGTDYTLSGNAITTFNSIAAGDLRAWYAYNSAVPVPYTQVYDEVVSGVGNTWTLAHPPNPALSLQLFQYLPSFSSILLQQGTFSPLTGQYELSGANITTLNSIAAGDLRAWYRY